MINVIDQIHEKNWSLYCGDNSELLPGIPDESIDFSVHSPPFESLFTYSPTERDLGNSSSSEEFFEHYRFVIKELFRITKSGRVAAVHVQDLAATLVKDGWIGLKDFSGGVIRAYSDIGWEFQQRIPIDKNQQLASIRTHAKSLGMGQMQKDRSWLAPAMPDYILKFRKPGENKIPVRGTLTSRGDMSGGEWIEYANPVWPENDLIAKGKYIKSQLDGIKEGLITRDDKGNEIIKNSLGYEEVIDFLTEIRKLMYQMELPFGPNSFFPLDGKDRCNDYGAGESWYGIKESDLIQGAFDGREEKDERHIAPLQLETIRRCIQLWSNPGEIVLDPFDGVGSSVFVAVQEGRKGIGMELKESWHNQAIKNVSRAENVRENFLI